MKLPSKKIALLTSLLLLVLLSAACSAGGSRDASPPASDLKDSVLNLSSIPELFDEDVSELSFDEFISTDLPSLHDIDLIAVKASQCESFPAEKAKNLLDNGTVLFAFNDGPSIHEIYETLDIGDPGNARFSGGELVGYTISYDAEISSSSNPYTYGVETQPYRDSGNSTKPIEKPGVTEAPLEGSTDYQVFEPCKELNNPLTAASVIKHARRLFDD